MTRMFQWICRPSGTLCKVHVRATNRCIWWPSIVVTCHFWSRWKNIIFHQPLKVLKCVGHLGSDHLTKKKHSSRLHVQCPELGTMSHHTVDGSEIRGGNPPGMFFEPVVSNGIFYQPHWTINSRSWRERSKFFKDTTNRKGKLVDHLLIIDQHRFPEYIPNVTGKNHTFPTFFPA